MAWDRRTAYFFWLGLAILLLLLMAPVWNALSMLHDPIFLFFVGGDMPRVILAACGAELGLFLLVVGLIAACGRNEAKSDNSLLTIGTMFISLLGASAFVGSIPMTYRGEAYTRGLHSCNHGAKAYGLSMAYSELNHLRTQKSCASRTTVEICKGFNRTEFTTLLKQMEDRYRCSGWCTLPQVVNASKDSSPLAARMNYAYPPTLFSTANHQATCDGMVKREIELRFKDYGLDLFLEGTYLIAVSIGVGFLKLIGACMMRHRFLKSAGASSYGATVSTQSPPPYSA